MSNRACALCSAPARTPFRTPPAEMAPDLDLRPGEPARSTLRFWLQSCVGCGASAPDLAALPQTAQPIVQGTAYLGLLAADPAGPFLRWSLIAQGIGQRHKAAEAALQAAWALDDAGQDGAAYRLQAVALWGEPASPLGALRQADVLRRAGSFERAGAILDGLRVTDEEQTSLLAFQRGLIMAGDLGRHSLSSALRPPARRPHVSHAAVPPKAGFWARLRGQ